MKNPKEFEFLIIRTLHKSSFSQIKSLRVIKKLESKSLRSDETLAQSHSNSISKFIIKRLRNFFNTQSQSV